MQQHQLTSFLASMFAPALISVLTTSLCPFSAATISGVYCLYNNKNTVTGYVTIGIHIVCIHSMHICMSILTGYVDN